MGGKICFVFDCYYKCGWGGVLPKTKNELKKKAATAKFPNDGPLEDKATSLII